MSDKPTDADFQSKLTELRRQIQLEQCPIATFMRSKCFDPMEDYVMYIPLKWKDKMALEFPVVDWLAVQWYCRFNPNIDKLYFLTNEQIDLQTLAG